MFESFGTYILYFLLSYIGLTLFFYTLSAFSVLPQASSFYARTLTSYGCLIICATYGVFASLFLRLVQNHRISQWTVARSYHYLMWWTTGVRFTIVSGEEHLKTRPMVLIGNHQSSLDVLFLADIWPKYCSVTAKDSLKRAPFLGWFMALSGTVFINRTDRVSAIKAFEGAAQEIRRERQSVFIFPEGTRHPGREPVLGDFKKGAFHLAVQAGVPIVPVVSANYWGVLSVQERRFRGGKIPAKVLPPISTSNLTSADVDRLTQETRSLMLRELIALSKTPMGRNAISPEPTDPMLEHSGILQKEANGKS